MTTCTPWSTSRSLTLPVIVTSYDGVEVTVESIDRVIAVNMTGTLAEIVFSLGLGDRLVGRDMSADFGAASDVPVVTVGGHNLSAEAILDLDPTLVITDENIGPAEVLQQVARRRHSRRVHGSRPIARQRDPVDRVSRRDARGG